MATASWTGRATARPGTPERPSRCSPGSPRASYTGDLSLLNCTGRWGNPKSGCAVVEAVSGERLLNAGPEDPNLKEVFGPQMQPLDNAPDRSGGSVAE